MKSDSSIKNTPPIIKIPYDEINTILSAKKAKPLDESNPFIVVAIGASAGGLDAMTELLKNL